MVGFLLLLLLLLLLLFIFFLLTFCGIDALPSFPGASTISSFSRFVVEGVFGKSGVVRSFEMVDPVLFVSGSYVLYCREREREREKPD